MEIFTGKVRGRAVSKNKDGVINKILLQVEITSPDDIQTVEWINHDGEDSSPPDNSLVVVVAISSGYKIAIACDDGILAESSPGEKILYSQLNGKKRASVVLKTDGSVLIDTKDASGSQESKIEMNSAGEINVTSFNGMTLNANGALNIISSDNMALNSSGEMSLIGSFINLNGFTDFAVKFLLLQAAMVKLTADFNAHKHTGVETGLSTSEVPETPIVIDISLAKSETVKLS
jgi:hypothetical protein